MIKHRLSLVRYLLLAIIFTTCCLGGIKSPFGSTHTPWSSLTPALQRWIDSLGPASFRPPRISDCAIILELELSQSRPGPLMKGGNQIKKMYIVSWFKDNRVSHYEYQNHVELTLFEFLSGNIQCYPSGRLSSQLRRYQDLMYQCGMIMDGVFSDSDCNCKTFSQDEVIFMSGLSSRINPMVTDSPTSAGVPAGRRLPLCEYSYQFHEQLFYRWHHQQMADMAYAHLRNHPDTWLRAERSGLYLIALGCGSGDDLHRFRQQFQKRGIRTSAIGIDIHPDLIEEARSKYPNCHFLCANALNACLSIRAARRNYTLSEQAPTLVIAEGLFTRKVLNGCYDALKVLQQLLREDETELVIAGGFGVPLINQEMMRASHWQGQTVMLAIPAELGTCFPNWSPVFFLNRQTFNQQMQTVKERSCERSPSGEFLTFDLSMSGDPLRFIEALRDDAEQTMKVRQLDLSYSHIEQNQVKILVLQLAGFPKLLWVLLSGHESWYQDLFTELQKNSRIGVLKREDNPYDHDLPTFTPKLARALRQYYDDPSESVYFPGRLNLPETPSPQWTDDIEVSGLPSNLRAIYHRDLLPVLSFHHLQLIATAGDGACFFHAVAPQLGMNPQQLIQILTLNLLSHQEAIQAQFPSLEGDQFAQMLEQLQNQAWAEPRTLQVISFLFNKRAILFYYDRHSGAVKFMVYLPDGTIESELPEDGINDEDIIVVHNGQRHFLGASLNQENNDLAAGNQLTLSVTQASSRQEYGLWPTVPMVFLFMTGWNQKMGYGR